MLAEGYSSWLSELHYHTTIKIHRSKLWVGWLVWAGITSVKETDSSLRKTTKSDPKRKEYLPNLIFSCNKKDKLEMQEIKIINTGL